jgi:hypothetical protein
VKKIFAGVVMMTLPFAPVVTAHEGHEHKIMGTISVVHENHLKIAGTDKKTHAVVLNEKTKVLRGTSAMKPADIKVGDRVVVTAIETKARDGKVTMVVKEVRLGAAASGGKTGLP